MGSFPEDVILKDWVRSGRRCECERTTDSWHYWHYWGRCLQSLIWEHRGEEKATGWEAHHIVAQERGGPDTLSNCEILCQRCHKATRTYG